MAEPTKINWRSHRFLLLDLDDQFRFWARTLFYRQGVGEVLSTADGFDALHLVDRTPPTMVLVDLVMAGMSAADFVTRLRKKPGRMRHIPVLLMAKSPDKPAIYAASLAGIEGIVVKPISEQALLGRVVKTLTAPERLVLSDAFVGANRRQADRAPTAGLPPPPSAVGAAPPAAESATPAPRAVTPPVGPRVPLRPRPTGSGGTIDMSDAPGKPARPAVRDWGDDAPPPPPKAPERIEVAGTPMPRAPEPAEVAGKKAPAKAEPPKAAAKPAPAAPEPPPPPPPAAPTSTADDWKEALSPERQEKMREQGPPSLDVPKLLEDHLAWLQSGGQRGFKARLEGADLTGMDLSNVNLSSANLKGINLSDCDCRGAVMEAADMRRGKLSGANLAGADLSHAQLRHIDLSMADLTAAKLIAADLAGANFSKAKLVGTDLTQASLLGADLSNADFKEAIGLTQLQLNKAYGDRTTKLPPGLRVASAEDWSDTQ